MRLIDADALRTWYANDGSLVEARRGLDAAPTVACERCEYLEAEVERLKAWKWFARMQMSDAALREVERRWAERGGDEVFTELGLTAPKEEK